MLYIVTALYEEALPFLQKYNLKRRTDFPHFELFAGENILLLITRPTALRAAAALSAMLTAFPPGRCDLLLSIGCAGCASAVHPAPFGAARAVLPSVPEPPHAGAPAVGQAFAICKITEAASGRTRYPDLLYRPPFPEAALVTAPSVQIRNPVSPDTPAPAAQADFTDTDSALSKECGQAAVCAAPLPLLYDMEAAGVYEAAIPCLSCDRILFVKVISDALTGLSGLSAEKRRTHVTECISGVMQPLTAWLDCLTSALCLPQEETFTAFEEAFFTEVCTALRLSVTGGYRLRQLMLYLKLSNVPFPALMKEQLAAPLAAPCRTKKEGLRYLEQLTEYYL